METENLARLDSLLEMLAKGQFVEGMEAFFDPNVTIQEVGQAPKTGRDLTISVEQEILSDVAEFIQYSAHSKGAGGDKTFYEATMEFKTKSGEHVVQNQAVVTTWKDGKIVDERYYHGNV